MDPQAVQIARGLLISEDILPQMKRVGQEGKDKLMTSKSVTSALSPSAAYT